jgi:hypothetical protein
MSATCGANFVDSKRLEGPSPVAEPATWPPVCLDHGCAFVCTVGSSNGRLGHDGRSFRVFPCPGGGAVEIANASSLEYPGLEVGRIDCHRALTPFPPVLVVRDATTSFAPIVGANLAAPRVTGQTALRRLNLNRARRVIRPKRAVSAADGAIAAGHRAGRSPHVNADGTAVTGRAQHGLRDVDRPSRHSITSKCRTRRSYSIIISSGSDAIRRKTSAASDRAGGRSKRQSGRASS